MAYNLNNVVSNQEAEALKELIFKRARERAQSLTNEIQTSYTDAVQTDIMDLARASFSAEKNPFAVNMPRETKETKESKEPKELTKAEKIDTVKRNIKELKSQIYNRNKVITQNISADEIEDTMLNARNNFQDKHSFIGALEFLNSQATIALISKHGNKSFEAMA